MEARMPTQPPILIAPSVLSSDFTRLGGAVRASIARMRIGSTWT